jgi:uncharacterized membrane protein
MKKTNFKNDLIDNITNLLFQLNDIQIEEFEFELINFQTKIRKIKNKKEIIFQNNAIMAETKTEENLIVSKLINFDEMPNESNNVIDL